VSYDENRAEIESLYATIDNLTADLASKERLVARLQASVARKQAEVNENQGGYGSGYDAGLEAGQYRNAALQAEVDALKARATSQFPEQLPPITPAGLSIIVGYLNAGNKIQAIKALRDDTSIVTSPGLSNVTWGLKACKDFVEALQDTLASRASDAYDEGFTNGRNHEVQLRLEEAKPAALTCNDCYQAGVADGRDGLY
jgi:hypothetical protein